MFTFMVTMYIKYKTQLVGGTFQVGKHECNFMSRVSHLRGYLLYVYLL